MKVKVDGTVRDASVSEYRCRDFVTLSFFIDGRKFPLSDTVSARLKLVSASDREREQTGCGAADEPELSAPTLTHQSLQQT